MKNRGKLVNFMVSDDEREKIQEIADKKGYRSVADFIRTLVADFADQANVKQHKLFQ